MLSLAEAAMQEEKRDGGYLLMPTEQDAHGLSSTFTASARMNLGETCRLRCEIPCCGSSARLCHSLVATSKTISPNCLTCGEE
jgi:hypothetical protein